MSEPNELKITIGCAPGKLTPEFAVECQRMVIELLQAIVDDVEPGAVKFKPAEMHWVDDGKDEIVIRVPLGAKLEDNDER